MIYLIGNTYYFRKRFPVWYVKATGKPQHKISLKTKDIKVATIKGLEELLFYKKQVDKLENNKRKYEQVRKYIKMELFELGLIEDISFPESKITIKYITELKDRFNAVWANKTESRDNIGQRIDTLKAKSLDFFLNTLKTEEHFEINSFEQSVFELKNNAGIHTKAGESIIKHPVRLSDAFKEWKKHTSARTTTVKEWELFLNRFTGVYGDLYIEQIERKHAREYREYLQKVPARPSDKYKNIPINQLAELADKGSFDDKKKFAPESINKQFDALASIVQIAIEELDVRTNNPFSSMQLKSNGPKYRKRYTEEDLNRIIKSINFVRTRPEFRTSPMFWIPLIAMFTGARLEEIGQLDVSDIQKYKDIYYISFNEYDETKSIKTGKIKEIPIHQELIKIGFLYYYKKMKAENNKKLFPTLKFNGVNYTAKFSKDFSKYMRKHIIQQDDRRKPIHAIRHSFKFACINSDVPKEFVDKFLGHASRDVGDIHYYEGYNNIEKLNQHIQKVQYDTVNFSSLYPENWTKRLIIIRTESKKDPIVIEKKEKPKKLIIKKSKPKRRLVIKKTVTD